MRVLVTGGTGYVGSHTVAALRAQGHAVRLLVRDPRRVIPALTPLGVPAADLDTIVGDVTDPAAVERAVRDCEAVIHAGSVLSLDSRDARRIREVNVRGTALVLGAGHRAGLDPIVYVSSVVALVKPNGHRLTPDNPPGHPPGPYLGSKAEAERVARHHQQTGAPVVITYPGAVYGPHDPHLGDGLQRLRNVLKGRYPIAPSGGYSIVDVRDVAKIHAAVLEPGRGPRRYLASGTFARPADLVAGLAALTGRRLPTITMPARMLLPVARVVQLIQLATPVHIPVEFEAIYFCRCANRCDDTKTRQELDVVPRDLLVTLADSVRWLAQQGHITATEAGILATKPDDELQPIGAGELPADRQR
jgi:nucleoside-diphosphate-sugar epimerase